MPILFCDNCKEEVEVESWICTPCTAEAEGVPNLDAMNEDELFKACGVFLELAMYTRRREEALKAREAGNVQKAGNLERKNEECYNKLPRWARW